jgi:hypothetical protein
VRVRVRMRVTVKVRVRVRVGTAAHLCPTRVRASQRVPVGAMEATWALGSDMTALCRSWQVQNAAQSTRRVLRAACTVASVTWSVHDMRSMERPQPHSGRAAAAPGRGSSAPAACGKPSGFASRETNRRPAAGCDRRHGFSSACLLWCGRGARQLPSCVSGFTLATGMEPCRLDHVDQSGGRAPILACGNKKYH